MQYFAAVRLDVKLMTGALALLQSNLVVARLVRFEDKSCSVLPFQLVKVAVSGELW